MKTASQMQALATGRLDAGLVRPPVDRRIVEMECVMREPVVLAMPHDHALSGITAPGMQDLERAPLIMYSPTEAMYFHHLMSNLFGAAEIMPDYEQHVSQIHTILAMVSAGIDSNYKHPELKSAPVNFSPSRDSARWRRVSRAGERRVAPRWAVPRTPLRRRCSSPNAEPIITALSAPALRRQRAKRA